MRQRCRDAPTDFGADSRLVREAPNARRAGDAADTSGSRLPRGSAVRSGDQMRRTRGGGLWEATADAAGAWTDLAPTGDGSIPEAPAGWITTGVVLSTATATVTLSTWQQPGLAPVRPFLQQSWASGSSLEADVGDAMPQYEGPASAEPSTSRMAAANART